MSKKKAWLNKPFLPCYFRLRPAAAATIQGPLRWSAGRGVPLGVQVQHKSWRPIPANLRRVQPGIRGSGMTINKQNFFSGLVTNSILFCWLFPIGLKKRVFNKRAIKICISCFWRCPRTSAPSAAHLMVSLFLCSSGSNARVESRALEGRRVSSKRPSRVHDGDEGVTRRNRRE